MNLPDKITTETYSAAEFTEFKNELQNFIESSGLTLASTSVQVKQAAARYAANAASYTDSGAANAYVLGVIGSNDAITSLLDGMTATFKATNTNTGTSTVNIASLGAKTIKKNGFADDVVAGDIVSGNIYQLTYSTSSTTFELSSLSNTVDNNSPYSSINETVISSTVSAVSIVSGIDSTYGEYIIEFDKVTIDADGRLQLEVSTDGGSTWESSGYSWRCDSGGSLSGSTSDSSIRLWGVACDTTTLSGFIDGEIHLHQPSDASFNTAVRAYMMGTSNSGLPQYETAGGGWNTAGAVDAIRLTLDAGDFTSGTIRLLGVSR